MHKFVTELESNQNIVHKVCSLYTNDRDSHNDLFQEITIQLWKAYPKFRGEAKFSTWMYRVALNTAHTTIYFKRLLFNYGKHIQNFVEKQNLVHGCIVLP